MFVILIIIFFYRAPFQPYLSQSYFICCTLSSHENQVVRAAAVEALANLYVAFKRCGVDAASSMVLMFKYPPLADIRYDFY